MSLKDVVKKYDCINKFAHFANFWVMNLGFDVRRFLSISRLPRTIAEYFFLKKQNEQGKACWKMRFSLPILSDSEDGSGVASGHYFHQDLYIAQKIYIRQPVLHVDVGSRVDGFVAHVATFRQIEVMDIRPLQSKVANIKFRKCNFMNQSVEFYEYCDSISCLHALEHFGLGRYGDPIDINGHLHGFNNLYNMLKPEGYLYLSFPIGVERIEFNAHRVFSPQSALNWAEGKFKLIMFSYVDDNGDLHIDRTIDECLARNLKYGCGIYEFQKVALN